MAYPERNRKNEIIHIQSIISLCSELGINPEFVPAIIICDRLTDIEKQLYEQDETLYKINKSLEDLYKIYDELHTIGFILENPNGVELSSAPNLDRE